MEMKGKNIRELKKAKQQGKVLKGKRLKMYPNTKYSNGKGGQNANNDTDFIIKDNEGNQKETLELAQDLAESIYSLNDTNVILKKIIFNAMNDKTKEILFGDIPFTVPKHCSLIKSLIGNNENYISIIQQLLMIGINDNGRYQHGGCHVGFINHMATALSAFHLFNNKGNKDIKKFLKNKKITNYDTFRKYLKGGKIIKYSDIDDLI